MSNDVFFTADLHLGHESRLKFTAEGHTYEVDGVQWPSVTGIIKDAGCYPIYTTDKRASGTAIHKACELLDEGKEATVEEEDAGYVESYQKMVAHEEFEWTLIERPLYHRQLGYCGTPDRFGWWPKRKRAVNLDIKRGKTGAETGLQLAGCVLLGLNCPDAEDTLLRFTNDPQEVIRLKAVLNADGSRCIPEEYKDPLDISGWIGLVEWSKWKRKNRKGV